jgi:hypothetical protein
MSRDTRPWVYRNSRWLIGAVLLLFGGFIGWGLGHQAGCEKGYGIVRDIPQVMSYIPVDNDTARHDQWLALCQP